MEKVWIGKITSTHGIKGEIRIISSFPYKEKAFHVGTKILIEEKEYEITSYRTHKHYDMITLAGFSNINEVLPFMKKDVYKYRGELSLEKEEVLDSDLMTYKILTIDGKCGKIKEIFMASKTNKVLRIKLEEREVLIPISSPLIQKIDYDKKEILIQIIPGM